jgi:hypothetical protein
MLNASTNPTTLLSAVQRRQTALQNALQRTTNRLNNLLQNGSTNQPALVNALQQRQTALQNALQQLAALQVLLQQQTGQVTFSQAQPLPLQEFAFRGN